MAAPAANALQCVLGRLIPRRAREHIVDAAARRAHAQLRHLRHRETDHRRGEHSGERGVLTRIVEDGEEGEDHANLARLEVARCIIRIGGDVPRAQGVEQKPCAPLRPAQEDHDVPVAQRLPVLQDIALRFQFVDTSRNEMRLDLECLALLLCLLILRGGVIGTKEVDFKRLRE